MFWTPKVPLFFSGSATVTECFSKLLEVHNPFLRWSHNPEVPSLITIFFPFDGQTVGCIYHISGHKIITVLDLYICQRYVYVCIYICRHIHKYIIEGANALVPPTPLWGGHPHTKFQNIRWLRMIQDIFTVSPSLIYTSIFRYITAPERVWSWAPWTSFGRLGRTAEP